MDDTRYQVRSPSPEIHETVRSLAESSAQVVLENQRRLSLSIRKASPDLIDEFRRRGATVETEQRYELDAPSR